MGRTITVGPAYLPNFREDQIREYTSEPNGFIREDSSTMGIIEASPDGTTIFRMDKDGLFTKTTSGKFAAGTKYETAATARTLAHYPDASQSDVKIYINGSIQTFSELRKVTWDATSGNKIFYNNIDGVLSVGNAMDINYIERIPIETIIYWDNTTTDIIIFADERHGIQMDGLTHEYLHVTSGAKYASGMGLSGIASGGTTYSSSLSGRFYDEDVVHNIKTETINPYIYTKGSSGIYSHVYVNSTKLVDNKVAAIDAGTGRAMYNRNNAGVYTLEPIAVGEYTITFFVATNDKQYHMQKMPAQVKFTDLAAARAAVQTQSRSMAAQGMPTPEMVFIGAVIVNSAGQIQTLEDGGSIFLDLRANNINSVLQSSVPVQPTATEIFYNINGIAEGPQANNVQEALEKCATLTTTQTISNKTLSASNLYNVHFTGSSTEKVIVSDSAYAAGTNLDLLNGQIYYSTAVATVNPTFNFRGDATNTLNTVLNTGESITVALLITNGGTAYYPTAYTIDGAAITPKWYGASPPTSGNASSIDVYNFTIIKTASATYTLLATRSRFA